MKPTYEELQLQLAAAVAENAYARERHIFIRALAVSILEHSGGRMDWRGAMEDATELLQTVDSVYAKTPATDAYLAEVRAQGVEMFAERKNNAMMSLHTDTHAVGSIAAAMSAEVKELREFAAQLRQGAEHE